MPSCPKCDSDRIRLGGMTVWLVYVVLVAVAIPATVLLGLNGAMVGGVMIAVAILAHLVFKERVCLDCGHQWKG